MKNINSIGLKMSSISFVYYLTDFPGVSLFFFSRKRWARTERAVLVPLTGEVGLTLGGFTLLFIILLSMVSWSDESEDFTWLGHVFLLTFATLSQQGKIQRHHYLSRMQLFYLLCTVLIAVQDFFNLLF